MSEEIIEKRTVKGTERPFRSTNETIQVWRFVARFTIAGIALGIFAGIVYIMLMSGDELPQSSKDLLNILIGAYIPILSGIAKFYFEQGGDLEDSPAPPPAVTGE